MRLPSPSSFFQWIRIDYNTQYTEQKNERCVVQNAIISSYMLYPVFSALTWSSHSLSRARPLSLVLIPFHCYVLLFFFSMYVFSSASRFLLFFIYTNPSLLLPPRTTFMMPFTMLYAAKFSLAFVNSNILFLNFCFSQTARIKCFRLFLILLLVALLFLVVLEVFVISLVVWCMLASF